MKGSHIPSLDDLTRDISAWGVRTFTQSTELSITTHLLRECAELFINAARREGVDIDDKYLDHMLWHVRQIRQLVDAARFTKSTLPAEQRPNLGAMREETADIFHIITHLARVSGFDLASAVADKFAINQQRVWQPPDEHGVVEHVRIHT